MTRRQWMILGWSYLAVWRGLLYTPINPGYGDAPLPLRILFDAKHIWISGTIWLTIAGLGVVTAAVRRAPWWIEQTFWVGILAGAAGWGGMYTSTMFLPDRYVPPGTPVFALVAAGQLYLAVALVCWATKDPTPPLFEAWRQRRDRSSRGK